MGPKCCYFSIILTALSTTPEHFFSLKTAANGLAKIQMRLWNLLELQSISKYRDELPWCKCLLGGWTIVLQCSKFLPLSKPPMAPPPNLLEFSILELEILRCFVGGREAVWVQ